MSTDPESRESSGQQSPEILFDGWKFGLDRLILVMTVCGAIAVGIGYWIRTFQIQHANPMGIVIYSLAAPSVLLLVASTIQAIHRRLRRYFPPK